MLRLSSQDYVLGGVCGGLAEYFSVDAFLCRIGAAIFFLAEPLTALVCYSLLYMVLPEQKVPNKTTKEAINSMDNGRYNEYSSVSEMKKEIMGK